MPLTDTAARQAKPKEKAYTLLDGLGLSLYVAPSGVKSWHFRFTWLGKQARISLGTYPDVGLKEARTKRDEAREQVASGIDPREARKEKKSELLDASSRTFRKIYEEWREFRRGKLSEGTLKGIRIAMDNDVLPKLGDRQIASITRNEVITLIRKIEARNSITSAVKTRQWMGQVFRYAIATGVLEINPCAEMHAVTKKIDNHRHRPFVDFSEIPKIIKEIGSSGTGHMYQTATLLMIYTACRPGEVRYAEWSEIDLDAAVWTIPAVRMKMRRDHVIPLSRQAVELLKSMLPISGRFRYVFPNRNDITRPMSMNYATDVMEACGLKGTQSPHGFRHMFSTEMNHRGYNSDWIERQLAHVDASIIRETYNHATYLEQRREMMQAWADSISE
ncbi:Prophage integrase IntS [compost metagenome]